MNDAVRYQPREYKDIADKLVDIICSYLTDISCSSECTHSQRGHGQDESERYEYSCLYGSMVDVETDPRDEDNEEGRQVGTKDSRKRIATETKFDTEGRVLL